MAGSDHCRSVSRADSVCCRCGHSRRPCRSRSQALRTAAGETRRSSADHADTATFAPASCHRADAACGRNLLAGPYAGTPEGWRPEVHKGQIRQLRLRHRYSARRLYQLPARRACNGAIAR
jgi:hypothetical protein